jgi:hypothetical protein
MQIQAVGSSEHRRCCEAIQDVFFDSASEEKSEGESVLSKCTSNDTDEVRHHLFIVALIDSIHDDDHGWERSSHRPNWIDDQFLKLALMRLMDDHIVRQQGFIDVQPRFWDRQRQIVCQCRNEVSDDASSSGPSPEKEARAESISPFA